MQRSGMKYEILKNVPLTRDWLSVGVTIGPMSNQRNADMQLGNIAHYFPDSMRNA